MPTSSAAGIGEKFNPINVMHQISAYIGENSLLFAALVGIIVLVAAFIAYLIWEEWRKIPAKEKSIRVGKTNLLQALSDEIKARMKRKKTRF